MPVRTILVTSWPGNGPDRQLDAALSLARGMGAHVEMLFIRKDPALLAATLLDAVAVAGDLPERPAPSRRRFRSCTRRRR